MRIRRRLIAIMIVLVALGLVAVDVVTYSSLHSYLYGRTDDQLGVAQDQVDASYLHAKSHGLALSAATVGRVVSPEVYVEILNSTGNPVLVRPSGSKLYQDPPPKLPAKLPVRPPFTRRELVRGSYRPDSASVNVPSSSSSGSQPNAEYRLQASALPGETLVVAVRLDSVTATLTSLLHIELAVSAGVVVALLVMLTLLIRRGLRPLEDMTEEAGAIAAGDLTRRVQPADEKSEIGRLGSALNGMLAQIELAFDKQRSSEDRLRRFLGDASHELRTPLTSIRGYAELLRKDALEDEDAKERALARIESESARMGVLVEDLLVLARMGESPVPETKPVDLAAFVTDAVEDARALDPSRLITLTVSGQAIIQADEQRIEQLIHNLLQNALVHTPASTPVDVRVERSRQHDGAPGTGRGPGDGRGAGQSGLRPLLPGHDLQARQRVRSRALHRGHRGQVTWWPGERGYRSGDGSHVHGRPPQWRGWCRGGSSSRPVRQWGGRYRRQWRGRYRRQWRQWRGRSRRGSRGRSPRW